MSSLKSKICTGCGIVLQTTDIQKAGYVPPHIYKEPQPMCQRCYKVTHYGQISPSALTTAEIENLVIPILKKASLIVWIIDFADLAGSLRPEWAAWCGHKPILLIINKIDLLPSLTTPEEMVLKIKKYIQDFSAKPKYYLPVSVVQKKGIADILKIFSQEVPKGKTITFFGATNVGKSSLLKAIFAQQGIFSQVTISDFRSTTQGLVKEKMNEYNWQLVDTPGLFTTGKVSNLLCPKCDAICTASKKLQSKLWHLKPGQTIVLGGLAGVTLLNPESATFIVYTTQEMVIHCTNKTKLADLQAKKWETLVNIPCKTCFNNIQWQEKGIEIPENYDIAWPGLGWISVRGNKVEVNIFYPKGATFSLRPALIGK